MKWKIIIIFCVLALGVIYLIRWVYPVLETGSGGPPMKEYNFSLNTDELKNKIIKVCNDDSNLNYKMTDTTGTTGTAKNDLNYYIDIHLKSDSTIYLFNLFYNRLDDKHSKINLFGAFDTTRQLGGYRNNNQDMQNLVNIFEDKFIAKLRIVHN